MKPLHTLLATVVVALLCASPTSASAQELVRNGGFQEGSPGTVIPGWSFVDPNAFKNINVGPLNNSSFQGAREGTQWVNLGSNPQPGTLFQDLSTVVGATYTFSFSLAVDREPPAGSNFFEVSFGNTIVFSEVNLVPRPGTGDPNIGLYTDYSYQVVATDTTTRIQFRHQHGDDYFRLDAVSVVPEPSTVSLLVISGAGALVVGYRRLRRRA